MKCLQIREGPLNGCRGRWQGASMSNRQWPSITASTTLNEIHDGHDSRLELQSCTNYSPRSSHFIKSSKCGNTESSHTCGLLSNSHITSHPGYGSGPAPETETASSSLSSSAISIHSTKDGKVYRPFHEVGQRSTWRGCRAAG